MILMIEDLLKESGFYAWVTSREVPKAREEGREEGRKEGQIEGQIEGRIKAQQEFLTVLAEQRFTTLSEATRAQIAATTDADRMKAAALGLATMPDEAALVAFLSAPPTEPPTQTPPTT